MAGESRDNDAGGDEPAILLLVDEADVWPHSKLRKVFSDLAACRSERVRVLLTARAAGSWWSELRGVPGLPDITWRLRWLGSLSSADLRQLAKNAGRSLAAALGWPEPPPLPDEVWDQLAAAPPPLSVELMVLARLLAAHAEQPEPTRLRAAVQAMLARETRYWELLHSQNAGQSPGGIQLAPASMARAVYLATLTGPIGYETACQLVQLGRIGTTLDPQQVVDDHAQCYPAADDDSRLAPLPSCLAEEFLAMLISGSADASRAGALTTDPWAIGATFHVLGLLSPEERETEDLTRRLCAAAGIESPSPAPKYSQLTFGPWLQPMIMRLVRAASTHPHLAENLLYPLAEKYPKAVVMAGSTLLSELAKLRPEPPPAARLALAEAASECDLQSAAEWREALQELQRLASHGKRGGHTKTRSNA